MADRPEQFIHELVLVAPQLQLLLDEHLLNNEELLPHVFMGDVTRFVIAQSTRADQRAALRQLLDMLDEGLKDGAADVQDLVLASFVENLMGETAAIAALKGLVRPRLKSALDEIDDPT